jgi:hypothetical protein
MGGDWRCREREALANNSVFAIEKRDCAELGMAEAESEREVCLITAMRANDMEI